MTKKDEEDLSKEALFTQITLLIQKNEELVAWNEAHWEADEVCGKAAAETLGERLELGSGKTGLEHVSLSPEEDGNPKMQYVLTESGTRLVV